MEHSPEQRPISEWARDYWDDETLEEMYLKSMEIVNTPEMWPAIILDAANETIGAAYVEFETRGMDIPKRD
jgi:hypothetical protein